MKLIKKVFTIINIVFITIFLLAISNVNLLASKSKINSNDYNNISDNTLRDIANKCC